MSAGWGAKGKRRGIGDIRERGRVIEFVMFHPKDSESLIDPWQGFHPIASILIEYELAFGAAIAPVLGNSSSQAWIDASLPFNAWCASNVVRIEGMKSFFTQGWGGIMVELERRYWSVQLPGETVEVWKGKELEPLKPLGLPWPSSTRENGFRPGMVAGLRKGQWSLSEPPVQLKDGIKVLEHFALVNYSHGIQVASVLFNDRLKMGFFPPQSDAGLQIWLNGGMGGWSDLYYVFRGTAACAKMELLSGSPLGYDIEEEDQVMCIHEWWEVVKWNGQVRPLRKKGFSQINA